MEKKNTLLVAIAVLVVAAGSFTVYKLQSAGGDEVENLNNSAVTATVEPGPTKKMIDLEVSTDGFDQNNNSQHFVTGYQVSYEVPFETKIDQNMIPETDLKLPIFNVSGEGFSLEVNVMYPPDRVYSTIEDEADAFVEIQLPNTTSKVLRMKSRSDKPNNYDYFEFVDKFFGKDPFCGGDNCSEANRTGFMEGITIDDSNKNYFVFASCTSESDAGIAKCDEVLKALRIVETSPKRVKE